MKLIKLKETRIVTRSYKYRIYPTKLQEIILNKILKICCKLYNSLLEERKNEYKVNKTSISYFDQQNKLSKNKTEEQSKIYAQVLQNVLRRVEKSYNNLPILQGSS